MPPVSDKAHKALLRLAGKTLLVALTAGVMVASIRLASNAGSNVAGHVQDGNLFRFNILSISADPVCINWSSADHLNLPRRPFMYLGQSNSTLVLYDYVTKPPQPLRVPASGIALSIANSGPGGWTCPSSREGLQG
jgi:hypothetical protein